MQWKRDTGRFVISGEILFLGKWKVGGAHYDSFTSKRDVNKWKATSLLPGIKTTLGHFATAEEAEEAKEAAEKAVTHWLSGCGLG